MTPPDASREYADFFARLLPALEAARKIDAELDRHLAHRFIALEYLRTDELGLSRIIADLLSPRHAHGQGPLYLELLLDELREALGLEFPAGEPQLDKAKAVREFPTRANRRIDICVKIPAGDRTFYLAIENKPYALDRKNQVRDYVEHLRATSDDCFLLIYLSPNGEGPTDFSFSRDELPNWRGDISGRMPSGQRGAGRHPRLAIMAYAHVTDDAIDGGDDTADPFEGMRSSWSLADWLAVCARRSEPERLRWFLRETEIFVRQRFGDTPVATDSEQRALEEHLLAHPDQLAAAQVVHEAWPAIQQAVGKRFLEHLRQRIEAHLSDSFRDLEVRCKYDPSVRWGLHLWIYRESWRTYDLHRVPRVGRGRYDHPIRQTTICLEGGGDSGTSPFNWYYGVRAGQEKADMDEERRARLVTNLRRAIRQEPALDNGKWGESPWWPVSCPADERWGDWRRLLKPLLEESESGVGGEVTEYYVSRVGALAKIAIPIIDRLEEIPHSTP